MNFSLVYTFSFFFDDVIVIINTKIINIILLLRSL